MKYLLSLLLVLSTNAYATYGTNLIGFGPQSRAMGGAGMAMKMGAESVLKNPALIHTDSNFSFLFAGSYFAPSVSTGPTGATAKDSAADTFMIPSIGFSYKINDKMTFGLGAYGTSGLGVDFVETAISDGLSRMRTAFNSMKFTPAVAYQATDNFSVGVGLSIMYGTMGISYDRNVTLAAGSGGGAVGSEGAGSSDDLGTGFDIGLAYTMGNFTIGANYQSAISMTYDKQLTDAGADFNASSLLASDDLAQPAEYGAGVAWDNGTFLVTVDYKMVDWEGADGYSSFGWENQSIISIGAQYTMNMTKIRLGYMSADSPLGDLAIGNAALDANSRGVLNYFNLVGFPATVEGHITAGVRHDFTKEFGMDLAYTMASEVTNSTKFDADGAGGNPEATYNNTHSQSAITLAGHWNF